MQAVFGPDMKLARSLLLTVLLVGCSKNGPAGVDNGGDDTGANSGDVGPFDAKRDGVGDGSGGDGAGDGSADSIPKADAPADVGDGRADSSGVDSDVPDLGPPLDAPVSEGKPTDSTDGHVCDTELAWLAQNARFDPSVGSPDFVAQVNGLIAPGDGPITLADRMDATSGAWTLQTSATTVGADFSQHFPAGKAPSGPVAMTRSPTGFASGSPEDSAFIHVTDAAATPADVWIPIVLVSTTATYGDTLCQSLTSATVSAVVPASAASLTLTTKSGPTSLGALLGTQTSSTPAGWNVKLAFDATKVGVSFK